MNFRPGPCITGGAARTLLALALLVVTTALTFSRVVNFQFLPEFDDQLYVLGNPGVLRGLTLESIRWAFTTIAVAFWYPLTLLSHMLDVELFGLNPAGHHLSSLLVHLGGTAALFLALRGLTGATWRSALVAAFFAIHPLHVESVAWVSERKDVLCGFFWFLGLSAYLWYVKKPGVLRYCILFGACAAALMSKSMAVTFPFVLLLLDFWPLGRLRMLTAPRLAGVWLEKIPLLLLIPIMALLSFKAQSAIGAIADWKEYALRYRVGNALISYAAYLGQAAIPTKLAAYYPHPGPDVSFSQAVLSGVLLALVTAACARFLCSRPFLALGWFWYLGTLVPVIGLVQIGQFARADRFTYLPLVGIFIAVVWMAGEWCDRWSVSAPWRTATALAAVVAYATVAWVQTGYWRDAVSLLTHTAEVTGDNEAARMLLGIALVRQGNSERAAAQFREVLRINGNTVPAMEYLADILDGSGNHEEALALRVRAQSLNLGFEAAHALSAPSGQGRALSTFGPKDYNNAGVGEARMGRYRLAEAHLRKALDLDPNYAGAHYNLANLFVDLERSDEAYAEYARTIAIDPTFASAFLNIGVLLQKRGDLPGARSAYEKALRLDPTLSAARTHLATLEAGPR